LEVWQPNRADEGWKCDDDSCFDEEVFDNPSSVQSGPPSTITITKELVRDFEALLLFYETEEPVFLLVRPRTHDNVAYIAGDASAAAYGSALQNADGSVMV